METVTMDGLFSDEVFTATELNRRVGTVLDHARAHPVTISRNNEQFALLPREQVATLIRTVKQLRDAVSLLAETYTALAGKQPSPSFHWLRVYDREDLQSLSSEIFEAIEKARGTMDYGLVDAIVHEWRATAFVAESGVIDEAMRADGSEQSQLLHPDECTEDLD